MIKKIAALSAAYFVGVCVTTHRKDKKILELQREHKRAEREVLITSFKQGWYAGVEDGKRLQRFESVVHAVRN